MDEKKLEIIQETMEVKRNEAEMALELAEGDLDRALVMIDYVDKNFIVVHGKFNYGSSNNRVYGLFSLIADGKQGEFIKHELALSKQRKILNISLNVNNKVFMKTLNNLDPEQVIKDQAVSLNFFSSFNPTEIFNLLNLVKDKQQDKIKNLFTEKLEDVIEEAVDLEIYTDLTTKAQLKNFYSDLFPTPDSSPEKEEEEEEKEKEQNKLEMEIRLGCTPIVSPTQGQKVSQLKIGDKLAVKITDDREIGQYLAKLLHNSEGITVGEIKSISFNEDSERYLILIQFGPSIYGQVLIEPEIKLAIITNKDKGVNANQEKNKGETRVDLNINKETIIIGSLIVLIILLLIMILRIY
ncbi:hypothetical protein MWH28_07980 [Natroniella sulfidigena]|uniref:hypothetical protein n=1 Tax=Natroniella sulfidigena TaxID=723921 RepID=UPI00200A0532|nr:hypothetical protein [Natroniella sulfidigena]MCK8817299.1 hypothetical protein [Natroniella sulfidigena]